MNQSSYKKVALEISGSPMTEIFLVDGQMRKVASGIGELKVDAVPGLYKIRSRMGGIQSDRLIEVSGDVEHQVEQAPDIETQTSAPISGTRTSHEYQAYPAAELSMQRHVRAGAGSVVFVFVRDVLATGNLSENTWETPAESVSIHALTGERLADLSKGRVDGPRGYGGVNVELDPGTYRIRVDTEPLGTFEMFVTTVRGWQTQVFFTVADFYAKGQNIRRPLLRDAIVLMSRVDRGFDPDDEEVRLVAGVRDSLAFQRPVLQKGGISQLLNGKFRDPLLGIYALHVRLLGGGYRTGSTRRVLTRTRELLGNRHPDILALHSEINPAQFGPGRTFSDPPLLRNSWNLILKASRDINSRIPKGSLLSQLAENFLSTPTWLIHQVVESRYPAESNLSIAGAERVIKQILEQSTRGPMVEKLVERRGMSGVEQDILRRAANLIHAGELPVLRQPQPEISAKAARQVFRSIDAPGYSIASAAEKLAHRFDIPLGDGGGVSP
jgi:hypothetical protein